jgi:hypothetical protein
LQEFAAGHIAAHRVRVFIMTPGRGRWRFGPSTQEIEMTTFGKTRKYLSLSFAAFAMLAGFVASTTPSHAFGGGYICPWTINGNICHWVP